MALTTRRQAPRDHAFRTHGAVSIEHARQLRRNSTEAERILWRHLTAAHTGHRFRRQHPIHAYIVDFVCIKRRLVIELDGGQHNTPDAIAYDAARTKTLEILGYRVLRFWNNDVMENLEGVYQVILDALNTSPDAPKHE